ncbi:hypothetical protein M0R45_034419 [Rubus argutus]|uniref:Leucine-rich repeat-containing N-terminal plant-type domain-containing protein n=1 Tax=Rubus argutus TaxID=59490 RepID=A0AAW1VUF4_RUBAR
MELGKWLKHAYAISIVVLLHINASLSLGHHHANVTRCVKRERDALLAIQRDLVDDYNRLSSWGSGSEAQKEDCCRWDGVYCDNQTGHVLRLDLGVDDPWWKDGESTFSGLQGTISPQLIQLHQLTYLNLSCNYFNMSQIPAFIGSLTNLRYLDLSQGGFGGQIPSHALGNLTHLTYLDLSYNDFNGSQIPAFIGSLTNLRYLDLSQGGFGGQIPSHALGNLTHLTYLDLSYNNFHGSQIPAFIGSLTSLRYLDLSWASFGGQIPSHALGNLTHLQYLNLRNEELHYFSEFPLLVENLSWLPHLSSL